VIQDEKSGVNVFYRLIDSDLLILLDAILGPAQGDHEEMVRHKRLISCPCPKCETQSVDEMTEMDALLESSFL
jgi:hypothetical protein